jgi:hypothetical protein
MDAERFRVIFEKVPLDPTQGVEGADLILLTREWAPELDEIAELRRLTLEVTEPHQRFFTGT